MTARSDAVPLRPLWSATAPASPKFPELSGALLAQVAIVGAGYTGLSAALHLNEQGRDSVLLERHEIGEGASGLNGGQVIAGVKNDPGELLRLFGPRLGPKLIDTVGSGPDLVFELIRKHGIACDAVRTGWIQAATSERELSRIRARVDQWRRYGADAEVLNREQTARLIGSGYYRGAWIDRRGGTVQPLAYARGLARAAQSAGSRIYVRSPAVRLSRSSEQWRLDTPRGSVTAPIVIIATDAYTDGLVDPLRRSLVVVPSFQVATAPLPPALRSSILPQHQSVSDTGHLLRYFRLDAGGRLLMGSRGAFDRTPTPESARHLYQAVREIFPRLDGTAFDFHWSGLVAITTDRLPHLHELGPGLLAGVGYNGRGIAMATTMGRLLARLAAGESAAELGFPITPVRPLRLHRFARLAARTTMQFLRARDRLARRRESLR
ncbi:MAG TPA: FAD-binding oxidoreductase [Steroidobacteraceae bacterium]|jgi:glycine/D-amino acid oxidase-like deaminating enzyme|nr:FAD-binding oxidoreductase [Steroidobacteraceae bacterium]